MRRKVSLLIANGHNHARKYPLGMVVIEAEFVVERWDREEANRALLIQMAVSSLLSKKGGDIFKKTIKQMMKS